MTKIANNPLLKGASGMLGETIVFREWRGRMVVSNKPKPRASLSEKQQVTVNRFKEAIQYAKRQMADPVAKAAYQARTNFKMHSAYMVALSDYMNAPEILYAKATRKGDGKTAITVKAIDDFMVVRVQIVILRGDEILEEGQAVQSSNRPFIWKYEASTANADVVGNVVKVSAFDKPGNRTEMEIVL